MLSKLMVGLSALGLAFACNNGDDGSADNQQTQMSAQEAAEINAPKYLLVAANGDGTVRMIATNEDPAQVTSENEMAEAESRLFAEGEPLSLLTDDEDASTDSFYSYGSYGPSCYGYSTYANRGPGVPRYQSCQPIYQRGNYGVGYGYNGSAYHRPSNTYYSRYSPYMAGYYPAYGNGPSSSYNYPAYGYRAPDRGGQYYNGRSGYGYGDSKAGCSYESSQCRDPYGDNEYGGANTQYNNQGGGSYGPGSSTPAYGGNGGNGGATTYSPYGSGNSYNAYNSNNPYNSGNVGGSYRPYQGNGGGNYYKAQPKAQPYDGNTRR